MTGGEELPGLLFYVFESALGEIDEDYYGKLGDKRFSYAGVFIYDMDMIPDPLPVECNAYMSSSSDYGHATMFFGEGNLRLEMKSAFSCFIPPPSGTTEPPTIEINASYKIVGGTGLFKHAKGLLEMTTTANPPPSMEAVFEGEVRLASDDGDDDQ